MPSIFERGGRYRGVCLKYRDGAGRTRQRQFPDREAAQAFLRTETRRSRLGRAAEADITVEEYVARWWERTRPTLRQATRRVYTSHLNNQVLPVLGALPLRRVGPGQIKDLLGALLAGGMAKKTVSNVRGILHAVFASACEDHPDVLPANPVATKMRLRPTLAERRAKVKALTAPELQRFLAAARSRVPAAYPILRFLSGSGCRPGEALGLKWEDVDLAGGRALIRRGITEGREEPTKTGHERQVDLGPALVEEMRGWRATAKKRAMAAREALPWCFSTSPRPHPLRQLQAGFHAAAKAAKLAPWHTPHHLRHTYATLALVGGESVYYVQRQLGHSTIQMTVDLYGSHLPAGSRETAARIEERAFVSPVVSPGGAREGSRRPKRARK